MPSIDNFDVIVVGGGAAGLMCAITAGQRNRRVIVLEGSNRIGKKILMSGGGRCNFTNLECDPDNYLSANPNFCISALRRYTQWDFISLVEKHGIPYHEKTAGQLFCDRSSKDIVALLQAECDLAGVRIETDCDVTQVDRLDQGFQLQVGNSAITGQSLVIASGGLSIPKMGASDFGYRVARQFGLPVLDTRAGLVPLTFTGAAKTLTERLTGVSVTAELSAEGHAFTEGMLFTHRGLSGPATLQISSYWQPGRELRVNLLPAKHVSDILQAAKLSGSLRLLRALLADYLPRALVLELQASHWSDVAETPVCQLANTRLDDIATQLSCWSLRPSGTEGYRTAEVTLGGVDSRSLSSKTMQANDVPGLYFIGEVVDVTGHLGGFNFQWAWASGHAAGLAA